MRKKLFSWAGYGLFYGGVLLLSAGCCTHWRNSNFFLLFCLALIIGGVVLYVWHARHQGRY